MPWLAIECRVNIGTSHQHQPGNPVERLSEHSFETDFEERVLIRGWIAGITGHGEDSSHLQPPYATMSSKLLPGQPAVVASTSCHSVLVASAEIELFQCRYESSTACPLRAYLLLCPRYADDSISEYPRLAGHSYLRAGSLARCAVQNRG